VNFCPECGKQRTLGSFCGDCGFKFPAAKESECPECGEARLDGAFCGSCGYKFTAPAKSQHSGNIKVSVAGHLGESDRGLVSSRGNSDSSRDGDSSKAQLEEQKELVSRLKYGTGFSKAQNCHNCGEPKSQNTKTCKLCQADIS